MTQRRLRPRHIVVSGDAVWLVDGSRPAAVYLVGDAAPRLVVWPQPEDDDEDDGYARVVAADGAGIVVQDGETITWIGPDGPVASASADDLRLSAADAEVAWLVDQGVPGYAVPGLLDDDEPAGQETGRIAAVRRDGAARSFETARPVRGLSINGDDLLVVFNEQPVAHPTNHGGHSIEYPTSTLRVRRADVLDRGLTGTPVRSPTPPPDENGFLNDDDMADSSLRWAWLETDPDVVRRYGVPAGGLLWWAGADQDGDAIERHALIRGHEPSSGAVVVDVDAGEGLVLTGATVGDELWLAVARQRFLGVSNGQGVEVLAVGRSGAIRSVLAPDAVDVSITNPAPVAQPPDHVVQEHAERVRGRFVRLETFWTDDRGNTGPLSEGLHDASATIEGRWPAMQVVVTLRHPSRPGLLLRRTIAVFDERGRPVDDDNADIELMEDLDTGYLPPADEAVDGVLEI